LLAGLASIALQIWPSGNSEPEKAKIDFLVNLQTAHIVEIAQNDSKTKIRLIRTKDGAWQISKASTEKYPADRKIVAQIDMFGRTRVERQIGGQIPSGLAPSELAKYGLGNPEITLSLFNKTPVEDNMPAQIIRFGDVAPDRLSRYVHDSNRQAIVAVADYQYKNLVALIMAATATKPADPNDL